MERLYWESFSFAPGVHTHHAWTEGGEIFARDMRNVVADENAYLRLRLPTGEYRYADPQRAVTGVHASRDHIFYLEYDGTLSAVDDDGFISDVVGQTGLSGRLWMVDEFNDFVIGKSEGSDKGFWTDFEDTHDYGTGEDGDFGVTEDGDFAVTGGAFAIRNLGIDPPDIRNFTFIAEDALSPNYEPLASNRVYVFRLSFGRIFTDRFEILREGLRISQSPELFEGMESNLSQPQIVAIGEFSGLGAKFVNADGFVYSVTRADPARRAIRIVINEFPTDPQVNALLVYMSEPLIANEERTYNIDNLEYRLVDFRSIADLKVNPRNLYTNYEFASEDNWPNQLKARLDNDRLPAVGAQITFYNDLVFAATGAELRYSDVRDGAPAQWAWPEANSILTDGEIVFCVEHRGVLLFGGPRGIWRLTGTDEFNFDRDRVSSIGPVSSGAWGEFVNGIGFIAEGGLYVTDGVGIQEVSSPVLDAYFEPTQAVDGAVVQLANGDELWSVKFDSGASIQFLRSSRGGFFTWHGIAAQQFAVEDEVFFADGEAEAVRTLEVAGDLDNSLDWFWLSQEIDFKEDGHAEALKTFKWLEVSSSHTGDGHLQVIVDGVSETVLRSFEFRGGSQRPTRIPINRRGERIQFRVFGVGEVILRSMRLMAQVRSGRGRF